MHFDLSPETVEAERQRFADFVVFTAAHSEDNAELLRRLRENLPKDFLVLIGEGSTRRCYATPLGVCVKVQRGGIWDDPLTPEDFAGRNAVSPNYALKLGWRRRTANLSEAICAFTHPMLVPRLYGFLGAFGIVQSHPSVLIAETCKTLDRYFPKDLRDVQVADMGIESDGRLWIFDKRITKQKRPEHLTPLASLISELETEVSLANIGVSPDGHFVFVDRSDHGKVGEILNEWTLSPHAFGFTFSTTPEQDLEFSNTLLQKGKEHVWQKVRSQQSPSHR